MKQSKLLIVSLFAFIVAVLAVYNQDPVNISFFGKNILTDTPMIVVIIGSVLFGVLITAILGFMAQSKLKKSIKKLEAELKKKKEKIDSLQLKIREFEEKEEGGEDDEQSETDFKEE
ncbi:MAG: lipopolysaccharide assembly protein LapA domain-containing protein [Elusimicrobia bacterium]|jgi:putative membrane protein|nr:lipopolysaccharide assembly protein LapA domain-containing protein [Elusimicrobiota bacterium]